MRRWEHAAHGFQPFPGRDAARHEPRHAQSVALRASQRSALGWSAQNAREVFAYAVTCTDCGTRSPRIARCVERPGRPSRNWPATRTLAPRCGTCTSAAPLVKDAIRTVAAGLTRIFLWLG